MFVILIEWILWSLQNDNFQLYHFLCIYELAFYCKEEPSLLLYMFIYCLYTINMDSGINVLFNGLQSLTYLIDFAAQIVLDLAGLSRFGW